MEFNLVVRGRVGKVTSQEKMINGGDLGIVCLLFSKTKFLFFLKLVWPFKTF